MLPMQPLLLDASDVRAAFELRDGRCEKQRAFLERHGLLATAHALAHDADAVSGVRGRRERRRDQILHRGRWQFGLRDEILRPWDGGGA
jgi:hypothetical protein